MAAKSSKPACKDCGSTTRKLTPPGPRCATCHREERTRRRARAHDSYAQRQYGLGAGIYSVLLASQNGVCALCQRARGLKRRLAIDHDHACCSGKESCGQCVRGLLCVSCNDVLATARDDPMYFARAINYLNNPPARVIIHERDSVARDSGTASDPEGQGPGE